MTRLKGGSKFVAISPTILIIKISFLIWNKKQQQQPLDGDFNYGVHHILIAIKYSSK